jgi:hypothetical protein
VPVARQPSERAKVSASATTPGTRNRKIFANFIPQFPEENKKSEYFRKKRKIRDCNDPN